TTSAELVRDFLNQNFTFTFDFLPGVVGPGTTGILASSATVGNYTVTGYGGYIVGDVYNYDGVDAFRHSVSGPMVGDLFPYFVEVQNARNFTLSFATSITPDVAFGVERVYGTVDSFSVVP